MFVGLKRLLQEWHMLLALERPSEASWCVSSEVGLLTVLRPSESMWPHRVPSGLTPTSKPTDEVLILLLAALALALEIGEKA